MLRSGPNTSSAQARLKTVLLPNGLRAACVSRNDLAFLYKEIFEDRTYLKGGVRLHEGDTVIDIGANVGLFSLFASEAVGKQGKVVAVEPIPEIHAALQYNVTAHKRHCVAQGRECCEIIACEKGAGSHNGATTFTFYPRAAGWSSMVPDREDVRGAMQVFLAKALQTGQALPPTRLAQLGRLLYALLPQRVFQVIAWLYISWMLGRETQVTCHLTTVSDIINECALQRVSLLKIDVERAEESVLAGIAGPDWPKIEQLVCEVHGDEVKMKQLQAFLKRLGFSRVVFEQADVLKGSSLWTLYACK